MALTDIRRRRLTGMPRGGTAKAAWGNRLAPIRPHIVAHIGLAVLGGVALLASVVMTLPMPLLTRHVVDEVFPMGASGIGSLHWIIGACFAIVGLKLTLEYVHDYAFARFRQRVVRDTKAELLAHVLRVRTEVLERFSTGYLGGRIQQDCSRLGGIMAATFFRLLRDALTFVVGAAALIYMHPALGCAALALVIPYVFATRLLSEHQQRAAARVQESASIERSVVQELLAGVRTLKVCLADTFAAARASPVMARSMEAQRHESAVSCVAGSAVGLIGSSAPLLLFWGCGFEIMAGRMTLGSWLAFQAFLGYLFGPASTMVNTIIAVQGSLVALDRIGDIFAMPVEGRRAWLGSTPTGEGVSVSFQDVAYDYPDGTEALNACSFDVGAGEFVAIVGPSGAGKSTLADVLARLRDPARGNIIVGGREIASMPFEELRAFVVIALQDGAFFSGSVHDNVVLGRDDRGERSAIEALALAQAMPFVRRLDGGVRGEVGEGGTGLSGGERQRVALARALCARGSVLVLDEPTNNLDARTSEALLHAVRRLSPRPTVVLITHSLRAASRADRIIVLDRGRVAGDGRHDELVDSCSLYASMQPTSAATFARA